MGDSCGRGSYYKSCFTKKARIGMCFTLMLFDIILFHFVAFVPSGIAASGTGGGRSIRAIFDGVIVIGKVGVESS